MSQPTLDAPVRHCCFCGRAASAGDAMCPDDGAPFGELDGAEPLRGRRLGGSYSVRAYVASGGTAAVYRGQDLLGRPAALKILHDRRARTEEGRSRLLAEGRALIAVKHPNVVALEQVAVEEDGLTWLATEWVDGEDLRRLLDREGGLTPARAVGLVTQLARGVEALHHAGIVHRDVKPENTLVVASSGEEHVKLIDTGAVARIGQPGPHPGTPRYRAPELATGGSATAASDVYSLGVVLCELLVGRAPGSAIEARQLLRGRPGVSSRLVDIVLRALLDMRNRTPTATDFLTQLAGADRPPARRPLRWVVAAVTTSCLAVGVAWSWQRSSDAEPSGSPAHAGTLRPIEIREGPPSFAPVAAALTNRAGPPAPMAAAEPLRVLEHLRLGPQVLAELARRGVFRAADLWTLTSERVEQTTAGWQRSAFDLPRGYTELSRALDPGGAVRYRLGFHGGRLVRLWLRFKAEEPGSGQAVATVLGAADRPAFKDADGCPAARWDRGSTTVLHRVFSSRTSTWTGVVLAQSESYERLYPEFAVADWVDDHAADFIKPQNDTPARLEQALAFAIETAQRTSAPITRRWACQARFDMGDLDGAVADCTAALASTVEPKVAARAAYYLALVEAVRGQKSAALELLKRAQEEDQRSESSDEAMMRKLGLRVRALNGTRTHDVIDHARCEVLTYQRRGVPERARNIPRELGFTDEADLANAVRRAGIDLLPCE